MIKEDARNVLEQQPFSFRQYKNGKISIYWNGKEIMMLKDKKAADFFSQVSEASEFDAQMIMAKITGNFKHGNERDGKQKGK